MEQLLSNLDGKQLLPLILSSSFLLAGVGLWLFVKSFQPIFRSLYKFFDSIFEDKAGLDEKIKAELGKLKDSFHKAGWIVKISQ